MEMNSVEIGSFHYETNPKFYFQILFTFISLADLKFYNQLKFFQVLLVLQKSFVIQSRHVSSTNFNPKLCIPALAQAA